MTSVLLVDDDLEIRREVSELLKEEGFEVLVARSGADALRVLRESQPGVILLDLVMPGTDGWEFRRAQLADPSASRIPVLVFSSFDSGPRNVVEIGAAGFVTKPFTIEQLLTALAPFRS